MNRLNVAVLYTAFAAFATSANIAAQWLSHQLLPTAYALFGSMMVGTVVGLSVKYLLDKRWIFAFKVKNRTHELRAFFLYSVMGVITTAIFWGAELLFEHLFVSEAMRYAGAVIGLAVGYLMKYNLDKRFVFVNVPSPKC